MQIILTQTEIETAIRDTVLSQINIRDDQQLAVVFELSETDETIAIIAIGAALGNEVRGNTDKSADLEPVKKTRQKRTPVAPPTVETKTDTKTEEPPFDMDPPTETATEVAAEAAAQETAAEQPVTIETAPAGRIFAGVNSSAPAVDPEPASPAPKSLFANLQRPTNGSAAVN